MKLWLGLLVLMVFGVGWTSNALLEPNVDGARPRPVREAEGVGSFERARDFGRRGPKGPGNLLTIRWFSKELGLTEAQQQRLTEITEEVASEYQACERRVRDAEVRSRQAVYELLSDEQNELLATLLRERHRREVETRVRESLRRVQAGGRLAELSPDKESEILSVFLDHELGKDTGRGWCDPEHRSPNDGGSAGPPRKRRDRDEHGHKPRDRGSKLKDALLAHLAPADADTLIESYFEGRGFRR